MHFLYILYSTIKDKFYVGETHDVLGRIEKHNTHSYENSFTKIASDWKLVLKFECANKTNALYLEQFIKKMKSKKFIEKIILNPEILEDILFKNNG